MILLDRMQATALSIVMYTGALGTVRIPNVLSNMLCGLEACAMAEAMLIGAKPCIAYGPMLVAMHRLCSMK